MIIAFSIARLGPVFLCDWCRRGMDESASTTRHRLPHRGERNHQGLGNRLITPLKAESEMSVMILRRERLSGTLNYYREAA
jgi:hypothetical protein